MIVMTLHYETDSQYITQVHSNYKTSVKKQNDIQNTEIDLTLKGH